MDGYKEKIVINLRKKKTTTNYRQFKKQII